MASPFEEEYKLSKRIKQGKSSIPEELQPLADWIDETYSVKTLNVLYDYMDKGVTSPRLSVILEYGSDKNKFYTNNGLNIDSDKQKEVAAKFNDIVSGLGKRNNGLLNLFNKKVPHYRADNLWVFFHDFEPYAKAEANEKVTSSQIEQLKAEVANEELWTIVQVFSTAVFFYYTDEQVRANERSGMKEKLSNAYFELVKPHDEFGYFKKDSFSVRLESKENFDKNYNGNWYNYFA